MAKRGPFIHLDKPTDVLRALNRYLQYKEIPANVDIDTLWKVVYCILFNKAGSRALYGKFINELSPRVSPEDVVQDVLTRATARLSNKEHEQAINFSYEQNIEWIWKGYYKKHKNKDVYTIENDPDDLPAVGHDSKPEKIAILSDCLAKASIGNELGYRAYWLKHAVSLNNQEIEDKLGREFNAAPKTIASAYFEFLCKRKICLEDREAEHRCWLELLDHKPEWFETIAVEEMKYKPKTRAYGILTTNRQGTEKPLSQKGYSERLRKAKKWFEECMQRARH